MIQSNEPRKNLGFMDRLQGLADYRSRNKSGSQEQKVSLLKKLTYRELTANYSELLRK